MNRLAHIRTEKNRGMILQTGKEHSEGSAVIAQSVLKPTGLGKTAYAAALLHDMGKFKDEYQDYLWRCARGEKTVRGSVIHSFAGARCILENYHKNTIDERSVIAEILAYAVGAHHGLFDIGGEKKNGFDKRIEAEGIFYEESRDSFFDECADRKELDRLVDEAVKEAWPVINGTIVNGIASSYDDACFYIGLLTRLILSALIEGDRTDTACFMEGKKWEEKEGADWKTLLDRVEEKVSALPCETEIEKARRKISDICRGSAEDPGGICRLNVPTGGGKTLSSLRYAIAHAEKYGKKRVVFVIPLLSVIEQNASVIREYLGDDSLVLEAHSNVVTENREDMTEEQYALMENWDSPVVITTLVQFMNAVYKDGTSCIRKFHSLTDSVIIIDEVQNVPADKLSLFNLAVNFLSEVGRSTIVLCSATQPDTADKKIEHPLAVKPKEIVPFDESMQKAFKRTNIIYAGSCATKDMPAAIKRLTSDSPSSLVICNKKSQAAFIYERFRKSGIDCFHFSAGMCMRHRKRVLEQVREKLKTADKKKPVICVATQAIEAGVDISFGTVVRLMAGLDRVIQADGRNNRNGERKNLSNTYILRLTDENLRMLPEIGRGKNASVEFLHEFSKDPERFDGDLTSGKSIDRYYSIYYRDLHSGSTCGPVEHPKHTIYSILSAYGDRYYMDQAFRTAGQLFRVFEDDGIDAIAPYEEGKEIIEGLKKQDIGFEEKKELIRKAKEFTVKLYPYEQEMLEKTGDLEWICGGSVAVLSERVYDMGTGLAVTW